MINPKECTRCGKEIEKPAAVLLGFPKNEVLCTKCVTKDMEKRESSNIESYLENLADDLEPKTHCCECTPGDHYDIPHMVHIQYPNCNCKKEDYVLKRNDLI